jgi:aryl-alcohol dehydrogenase-like predicted oxidoreductase
MKTRKLGTEGLQVSAIGLGCMSMTDIYGPRDDAESKATLLHALDSGVTFIDTSDMYGNGQNETLIGEALKERRGEAILATKFGNLRLPDGTTGVNGRPDYVVQACEASLTRLRTDVIDLYFVHRIDPEVPIEDTVGAMAKLVAAGKVRYIGLSEAGVSTLRRAHATHPLTALQTEYSLWTRDVEAEILPACRGLGIGFVPYAPLGRGFLTGTIDSDGALNAKDRRRDMPRFKAENLGKNLPLLGTLRSLAADRAVTPAQVAIAWLLGRGDDLVPIPGTKKRRWLDENAAAVEVALTDEEIARLDRTFRVGVTSGTRYPEGQMTRLGI